MHSIRQISALAAVAGALALPATAAADSIVYTRDHNVWIADGEGGGQYQVTTDGSADNPWRSPSQADDGTIVAARAKPNGGPLHRLRQNGDVVNQIPLPAMQAGPFDPAVSPDGALVAYEHTFARYVNGWLETGSDIRYARSDGSGGSEQWPGVATGATAPSWVDSGRILAGRGSVAFTQTPGAAAVQWWSDYDHYGVFGAGADLSDGEAAGGRVAMVRGGSVDGNTIVVYAGAPGATPQYLCTISDPAPGANGRRFADPTLSADGRRVYTQQGDGIYLATAPAGDGCGGWTERKLIDGGAEPDWGPANVNPGPRTPQAPGDGGGSGGGSGGGAGGGGGGGQAPVTPPARTPAATPRTAARRSTSRRSTARRSASRCSRLKGTKRTACLTREKRARAVATCRRTKRGKALARCLKAAKRVTVTR